MSPGCLFFVTVNSDLQEIPKSCFESKISYPDFGNFELARFKKLGAIVESMLS